MNVRYRFIQCMLIIMVIMLVSCSGNNFSPTSPSVKPELRNEAVSGEGSQSKGTWGFWDVAIDTESGEISVEPLRGVMFKANVTMFLQPPAGSLANLKFVNLDLDEYFAAGVIDLDVGLTHPFPGVDKYTGFDVLGVFMHNGSWVSGWDGYKNWSRPGIDAILLNADGYTRWFNPVEFDMPGILGYTPGAAGTPGFVPDAILNPYKYFADDLEELVDLSEFFSDAGNCDDRGCFRVGSTNFRHYSLQFPMEDDIPVLKFQYGVFANWEPANEDEPNWPISDFPISANMAESIIISIDTSESDLYYIDDVTRGGTLRGTVEILDHQGARDVGGVTGQLGGLRIETTELNIWDPAFAAEFTDVDLQNTEMPGGPSSSVYTFEVSGCEPIAAGDTEIMITVLAQDAEDYDQGIPGFPFPEGERLASYFLASVNVSSDVPDLPPVGGDLSLSWDCPGDPCSGVFFTMEISEAYDPDGDPVTITWDFDGNLDYLDDMDGDDTNLSALYVYNTPGVYECWCRIDDGTMQTDVGPFEINVMDCIPDDPTVTTEVASPGGWFGYDVVYNPDDGYAYAAVSTGSAGTLKVIDLDPIETAGIVGSVSFGWLQNSIAYKDGYCYIAGVYLNGISTVDVSTDPTTPTIIDTYYQGLSNAMIFDLDVVGDYLYAAAQWGGIMVFDISDPADMTFVGQTPGGFGTVINSSSVVVTDDNQWGFYTDGYEVNPDYPDYVKVVDLSDPSAPTVVHEVDVQYHFNTDMDIEGDYIYLTETEWFTVIDISDPETAEIVFTSNSGFGGSQYGLEAVGSYVYMVKGLWGSGTLTIIDVSDPLSPSPYGTLALPGGGMGISEYCGELYIAASYNALDIVDLY